MNTASELLVIASYPPKGEKHSSAIVGGAMYAKNTFQAVIKEAENHKTKPRITILAEILKEKPEIYEEDGLTVKRHWKRGSMTAYAALLREIFTRKGAGTVVIEFEFAMFGERLSLLPLPLFLLLLRLLGKRTVFVFHQVVSHIGDMGGHLNIAERGIKTSIMNLLLQNLYRCLLAFSSEAIVFEEIFKKRLGKLGDEKKVTVIPFGTEIFSEKATKREARRTLSLPEKSYIVFVFGFLAWYKGTDWLVTTMAQDHRFKTKKHIHIVLGGGGNPNHMNKPYYVNYIETVKRKAEEAGITVTGFISENDMPLYFVSADLILLPYRTMMSSSGPLSLAFSFDKPFFLSHPLKPLFETADIREALYESGIQESEIIFQLNDTFPERLEDFSNNMELQKKVTELSKLIAEKRSWQKVGKMYYDVFFKTER